jgi:hypothetical protein
MATEGVVSFVVGDFHRAFVGLVSNSIGLASAYREHSMSREKITCNANEDGDAEPVTFDQVASKVEPATDDVAFSPTAAVQLEEQLQPLSTIVIIPQRRPGVKKRGFFRAYAPVLQNAGISQQCFLRFLDEFDAAAKANPTFTVVALAAEIVGMVPEAICMAVSACVKIAANVAAELQIRRRTNGFIGKSGVFRLGRVCTNEHGR